VAASAVLVAIPELFHIGTSVNNDNLLIPLLAGTTLVTASVARGDVRLRTAGLLGLLAGLALLTKGLALYLPLTMGLGYLVAATRTSWRKALPAGALAMGVALAVGGWWWLRNLALYGTFQPDGRYFNQPHLIKHTTWDQTGGRWLGVFARLVNQRFWNDPGPINLPHVLSVATTVASIVVLVGLALTFVTRRPGLADSVLLLLPFLCLLGILAKGSWTVWSQVIRPAGMQGRYMYGGVPGMAVLAVAGVGHLLGSRQRWLPVVVLALGGVMQLLGMWLTFRTYWLPKGGTVFSGLHNLLAWSAWPAPLVVLVVLGLGVAVAGTFSTLIRDARAARGEQRSSAPRGPRADRRLPAPG
jgi:4-amino-4-deoxy-L-arabinose transferase-like glycosyltransferase